MARFSMAKEFEVKEPVDSPVIVRLRTIAEDGKVDAFSLAYRHPRFKTRITTPHFYAKFRRDGLLHIEDGATLDALDAILEKYHLSG